MPIVSGGMYHTEQAQDIVERLLQISKKECAHQGETIKHDSIALIAGRRASESPAERIELLSDNESLLAGRLFSKKPPCNSVDNPTIDAIKKTMGTFLGENYWGSYIIVSADRSTQTIRIYRDPQGLSTLFYVHIDGGVLFSSEISFLYDALPTKPALDWSYLTSFVGYAHNVTRRTPFVGIMEVAPGCETTLRIPHEVSQHIFWNPANIQPAFIQDEAAFEEQLYQTVAHCTAALTEQADTICTELSGGLDSSSLLAVLSKNKKAHQKLLGVNILHSDIGSSNEIEYAQDVADTCNTPLQLADCKNLLPFTLTKIPQRFSRPTSFLADTAFSRQLLADTPLNSKDEVLSGQGGDHLFLAPPFVETIADYFLQRGLNGITTKIQEISAYHRMPYLQVLGKTAKILTHYMIGNLGYLEAEHTPTSWMTPKFNQLAQPEIFRSHYWSTLKGVTPAKAQHIIAIEQAVLYIDRGYRIPGKPVLNPLLSQPVVELALSMPVYQSFANGYNRVLYRKAIAKHHTGKYIWRKSKGETSGVLTLAVQKHFDRIKELITEGRFAQEGLVDIEIITTTLTEFRHGKTENLWPLLNLMVTEIWLRSWEL